MILSTTLACATLLSVAEMPKELAAFVGDAPAPVAVPHFPTRMHAFIWRNWTVVEPDRLAKVLGTTPENVRAVAESMGLPPSPAIPAEFRTRGYITILRRNWHLLPYEQLLTLLDMTPTELAHTLREDDFLIQKFGNHKPACEPIRYVGPDAGATARASRIREIVRKEFGAEMLATGEPRFAFIERLSRVDPDRKPTPPAEPSRAGPRYIYSYFALYGDPLMTPELDPFPDGLLQRLAELGIRGVWMHTVLRQLAPSDLFPEFGAGHETRLANLRRLVERARRYGIGIYLYVNEPRAMPRAFFEKHPEIEGVHEGPFAAMCTSTPQVRRWLTDSLAHVFRSMPDLAGVFTITASENLTSCASHFQHRGCPRCKDRAAADIIAEVNVAVQAGVHRGSPEAQVICWDWGWDDSWAADAIARLPKNVWFMSVSEWATPVTRGGVKGTVGEYSISVVGPGPRASRHWAVARQHGLRTVAKVQVNNTWELSAVPYLPVLDLVAEHCANLAAAGVDGMMLSWTLGGYPSPNLQVAQRLNRQPPPDRNATLDAVARERFGVEGAPHARRAWTAFSEAFREFPYDAVVLYNAPQQYGPANLLHAKRTGYRSTMVGFPYDDVDGWRGPYPADVFASQMEKVAAGWKAGLPELQKAVQAAPPESAADARAELAFAEAAQLHFQSVADQTRFTVARNALQADKAPTGEARKALVDQVRRAMENEIATARRLFTLAREDSRIGYEASNHYYYVPVDLVEKVVNVRYILEHWVAELER